MMTDPVTRQIKPACYKYDLVKQFYIFQSILVIVKLGFFGFIWRYHHFHRYMIYLSGWYSKV